MTTFVSLEAWKELYMQSGHLLSHYMPDIFEGSSEV